VLNLRNVLLTAHVLVAMLTIGWLATQGLVMPALIRKGPANAAFVRVSSGVASKVGPASALVFLLGIWLVLRDGDDAYDFSDAWISASMLIFVVTAVVGAVGIGRTEERAAAKLEAGESADAEASRLTLLSAVETVLFVVVLWLMVAKPGG
jgi:uncharacterized membrane protein